MHSAAWRAVPGQRRSRHAFEVDGKNYPPTEKYDADEAGRWRVEVRPKNAAKRDYFLHVLATGNADGPITPAASVSQTDQTVTVTVKVDGKPWKIRFDKTGELVPQVESP